MTTTAGGWLRPTTDGEATDFAALLARSLAPVTVEDFGGEYPWDRDVPPRSEWLRHSREFRAHLVRAGWYRAQR